MFSAPTGDWIELLTQLEQVLSHALVTPGRFFYGAKMSGKSLNPLTMVEIPIEE
jgi:hypothetical protein